MSDQKLIAAKRKQAKLKRITTPLRPRRRFTEGYAISVDVPEPSPKKQPSQNKPPSKPRVKDSKAKKETKEVPELDSKEPLKDRSLLNEKQIVCKKWFEGISKVGLRGLREEFMNKIKRSNPAVPVDACKKEENRPKNRYEDVFLIDSTRVKIKINPNDDDYIHASFVNIGSGPPYICAQGPLPETIQQFWLMCIQEEVEVILQLCQNIEEGAQKCEEYLPTSTETWTEFGAVKVKVFKESTPSQSLKAVSKTIISYSFEGKEAKITHLLYTGWPDHAAPDSIASCRELKLLVSGLRRKKPIVVHCSAGIGRTGAFVTIEAICHKLFVEQKHEIDMVELMQCIRSQRMHAIQNDLQYSAVFRCVVDILIAEEALANTPEVVKFIKDYEKLNARKKQRQIVQKSKKGKPTSDQPEA